VRSQSTEPLNMVTAEHSLVPAATVLYGPDAAVLDRTLTALDQAGRRLFIFVNGQIAAPIEERLSRLSNANVLRSSSNIGLGAALNAVTEAAYEEGFKLLLLLDQDSEPAAGMPDALAERFRQVDGLRQKLAALGPLLVTPPDGNYRPMRYDWFPGTGDEVARTAYFIPTSGTVISIPVLQKTGGFRADYFIGGIDVEWGFRARKHGYASAVATDVTMVHRWGGAAEDDNQERPQILRQSDVRNYYYLRNSVDCLKQPYVPWHWKLQYAVRLAAQAVVLLTGRRFASKSCSALWQALASGWRGKLGPIPMDRTVT
jgi:rhamnosyltransferase